MRHILAFPCTLLPHRHPCPTYSVYHRPLSQHCRKHLELCCLDNIIYIPVLKCNDIHLVVITSRNGCDGDDGGDDGSGDSDSDGGGNDGNRS